MEKILKSIFLATFSLLLSSQALFSQTPHFWEPVIGNDGKFPANQSGAMAVDPTNGNILIITQESNNYTLYLYDGNNWILKSSYTEIGMSTNISSIALAPNGDIYFFGGVGNRVYKIDSSGANWSMVSDAPSGINTILITGSGDDYKIYFGTEGGGFYRPNSNGGWEQANNGLPFLVNDVGVPSAFPIYSMALGADATTLYAGSFRGLYYSVDDGDNWILASYDISYINNLVIVDTNTIFATLLPSSIPERQGVFKSIDKGANWIQVNNIFPPTSTFNFRDKIIYNSKTGDIFVTSTQALSNTIYRSTNLGTSWEDITGFFQGFSRHLAFDPITGQTYIANEASHVYRFTENNMFEEMLWEPISSVPISDNNLPLQFRQIHAFAVANNGDLWAATGEGIFLSTNSGNTWFHKNNGLPTVVDVDIDGRTFRHSPTVIEVLAINPINGSIFTVCDFALFRSTDNGESWTNILDLKSGGDLQSFVFTPSGEIYVKIACFVETPYEGICYSNDNGNTWIQKNNGLPTIRPISGSLAMGPDGALYTGIFEHGMYRSTDCGNNWLPSSNYTNQSAIADFTVSADGSIFAAAWGTGVLKSTDKGITWNQANEGISYGYSGVSITQIIYNPITGHLFAPQDPGFTLRSTNLGESWYREINSFRISGKLAVNSSTGEMFINSSNTIYRSIEHKTSGEISVKEPAKLPTEYNLSQNYPNPFNPTTTIQYSIPKDEHVKLIVYDITGREVKELVNEHKAAGIYNVSFDASSYSSGIYYYRLETVGYNNTQKMVLIK